MPGLVMIGPVVWSVGELYTQTHTHTHTHTHTRTLLLYIYRCHSDLKIKKIVKYTYYGIMKEIKKNILKRENLLSGYSSESQWSRP